MYVYGQSYIQELSQVRLGLCEALKCCNPSWVIRGDKMLWINLVRKYGMVCGRCKDFKSSMRQDNDISFFGWRRKNCLMGEIICSFNDYSRDLQPSS